MQDYSGLGITSIPDRKKLFQVQSFLEVIFRFFFFDFLCMQLVQSLRQEIPTLENGLVSSPVSTINTKTPVSSYRYNKSPPTSNASVLSSPVAGVNTFTNTSFPDVSSLNISSPRRGSGQAASSIPQIPTRSRSRTIPFSTEQFQGHQRPDFVKSNSNSNFSMLNEESANIFASDNESENSDKCEIRRGSGPLLDFYGLPIQNKPRYNTNNTLRQQPTSNDTTIAATPNNNSPLQQQLPTSQSDLNQKIRVCVRKRPLNKKEIERGEKDIAPTAGVRSINVNEPKYACV